MIPRKGTLKIFFGYAEDNGESQAMLDAAMQARSQGKTVFICTADSSFDLDEVLRSAPDVAALDGYARKNGASSRHKKRYQDVEELLNAGIDVYTSMNVTNIESLHDMVTSVIGRAPAESVPDSAFDSADLVELVDMEPQEAITRLQVNGKVLSVEQLAALREMAYRRCANRLRHRTVKSQTEKAIRTDEHVLVCLSSSPSNARIIRTAARMAKAFDSQFTALFIETPSFAQTSEENKERLQRHYKLASQAGASVETVYGEDVPYQIAQFARLSGVTKVVLGRSAVNQRHVFKKANLSEQLLHYAPELDLYIIPDSQTNAKYYIRENIRISAQDLTINIIKSLAILAGATSISMMFYHQGFTEANIIMVYILGVLMTSMLTSHYVFSLISSISSVMIFNYLFTVPRFSLTAYETGYPVTFLVMFVTAYVTSTSTLRYKDQAGQSAKYAYRTILLYDTNQRLAKAKGSASILQTSGEQIMKLLHRTIVIFNNVNGELSEPEWYCADENTEAFIDEEAEMNTARWVLTHNHAAGAGTDTMSDVQYYYLAIRINDRNYGVVGIKATQAPLDVSEREILLSILGEAALALENDKNAEAREQAAILAESEQLRANLLRSISHDLRTPLTGISGNAGILMQEAANLDEATKQRIYQDIYDDSQWLIKLVENLLYATRIEEGRMMLQTGPELASEMIAEAMQHLPRRAVDYHMSYICEDELLMVHADAKLIIQVIINLIDNAVKYTPPGSSITIKAEQTGSMASISVADTGFGIPDEEKGKIFEKFYCADRKIADNRRSLGLGLFLCRAIVEAHGGTIEVKDNDPQGALFVFTLPVEEVKL